MIGSLPIKGQILKMISPNKEFHVITGGPGVGKTTLLQALKEKGYATVPEDARRIIEEQIQSAGKGLPWKDRELYTNLMLDAGKKSFMCALDSQSDDIFFDRSIIDAICYANMTGLYLPKDIVDPGKAYQYNKKVFILPPWQEIFENDEARKQTWQEAVETFDWLKKTYTEYGYEMIEVPLGTVECRANFIVDNL